MNIGVCLYVTKMVKRSYTNFNPNASYNYNPKMGTNFRVNYRGRTNQPSTSQLQNVLDVSNPQTPVLYANPGTNITKPLIEAYNTASGVAAPAAKPANTPARPSGAAATRPPAGTTPKKP